MPQVTILLIFLVLWLADRASADGGDDFANNLASDLGPIISLFGERVVMQFMSQAMGLADCILLAVAPIGAITVVVSAIRVAGPAWLKSFIGRARENISAAEVEVMSSTSDEACELWNGYSVVRCPGSADMYQFICLVPKGLTPKSFPRTQIRIRCEELKADNIINLEGVVSQIDITGPKYAWKSFQNVAEHVWAKMRFGYRQLLDFLVSFLLPRFRRGRRRSAVSLNNPDLESCIDQDQTSVSTQMQVNASERTKVTFRASPPRSTSRSASEKIESSNSDSAGKIVLTEDEKKEVIVVMDTSGDGSPNLLLNCHDKVHRGEIYLAAAFSVILQLGAVIYFGVITYHPPIQGQFLKDGKRIVDYAFPCTAAGTVLLEFGLLMCAWAVEKSTTETCYEAPNHDMFIVWLQKDRIVSDQVFKPYALYPSSPREHITKSRRSPRSLEQTTSLGALVSLLGFVSQFIGMRGLNWTASVVQLGITLVVTVVRVIVRRGLVKSPSRTQLRPDNELDWFSLTFGDLSTAPWRKFGEKATDGGELDVPKDDVPKDEDTAKWRIRTGGNRAYIALTEHDFASKVVEKESAAHNIMVTREKLCRLSKWKSPVSEEAARLSRAIHLVAQTFLKKVPESELVWTIPATYESKDEEVFITFEKRDGQWQIPKGKIEAVLSLWSYSTPSAEFSDANYFFNLRIYGKSHLRNRLSRDFVWLTSEMLPRIEEMSKREILHAKVHSKCAVVGFMSEREDGMEEHKNDRSIKDTEYLVLTTIDKTERVFARDLLFSFIRAVAKRPDVTIGSFMPGERPKTEAWEHSTMQLNADPFSNLARNLESLGIGTLSDIYLDLIVPFTLERKTGVKDVINEAIRQAQQYERSRQWKRLVETCSSLLDLAQKFDMKEEASGPLAVAVCIEYLYRLRHEVGLQKMEGRSEAEVITQLGILEENFVFMEEQLEGSAVFPGIKSSLAESSGDYTTTFGLLIGTGPNAVKKFPESFNVLSEHQDLTQTNGSERTLYWSIEELKKTDAFGWSPLHYAANLQLGGLRIVFSERGQILNLQDFMGRTPLHHACLNGNEEVVDLLLDRDAPIEVAANDGVTAIHCAVLSGNVDILKKLVEKVNEERLKHRGKSELHVDRNERHPIHWAAAQGRLDLVRLLKDDINRTDRFGWACIHLAVIYNHIPLLEGITKSFSAKINLRDNFSRTPLHLAVVTKSLAAVDALIKAGAQVKVKDKDGLTPLHMAVKQEDIARKLIDSGADINAIDTEGRTALFLAAELGMAEIARLLIDAGANVKIATKDGRTALHMAIRSKDITAMLLKGGAAVNAEDIEGYTPLHLAMMDGTAEVVALLMEHGADVAVAAEDGRTLLHMALSRGEDWLEIANKLLDPDPNGDGHNPYVDAMAEDGATPLHVAAEHGPLEVVEMLLKHRVDIDATDEFGQTALLIAVYQGNWDIAESLLAAGADINADDRAGYTPLLGAVMGGQEHIVEQLLEKGADVNAVDDDGYSSIHLAVYHGFSDILRQLLDAGKDYGAVNAVTTFDNQTPLHIAVRRGNVEMVQILLENGAKTEPLNHLGFTPLQYALCRGKFEIVKIFVQHAKSSGPDAPKAALQRSNDGGTPLHTLCRWTPYGTSEDEICDMLEVLLSVVPDIGMINAVNDEGLTPLDLAHSTMDRYPKFIELLTKRGAKPSDKEQTQESLISDAPLRA